MKAVVSCKAKECEEKHYSKGFCGYHYRQFRRDWIDAEGNPTELWRDCSKVKCAAENCETLISKQARPDAKFCKLHYNYKRFGSIDENGKYVKEVKRRTGKRCKVLECTNGVSSKNKEQLCSLHFKEHSEGAFLKFKHCKLCPDTGPLSRGFCKAHYANFKHGIIDENGEQLRDLKRRARYSDSDRCRISGCKTKPNSHFMCERHRRQFLKGDITAKGTPTRKLPSYNRGQVCSQAGCKEPAYCKLLCKSHYGKKLRGFLNAPKPMCKLPCKVSGCKELGHAKGLCAAHYRKMRYMTFRPQILEGVKKAYARRKALKKLAALDVQMLPGVVGLRTDSVRIADTPVEVAARSDLSQVALISSSQEAAS